MAADERWNRCSPKMLELDLATVMPSVAGPRRPQDRVELRGVKQSFRSALVDVFKKEVGESATPRLDRWSAEGAGVAIGGRLRRERGCRGSGDDGASAR